MFACFFQKASHQGMLPAERPVALRAAPVVAVVAAVEGAGAVAVNERFDWD